MGNNIAKPSARKQAQGALERITELEKTLPNFMFSVDRAVGTLQNQVSHSTEIMDAIVGILGEETVNNAINQNRINKAIQMSEARKQAVVQALEAGKIVTEETIRGAVPKLDAAGAQVADENGAPVFTDLGSYVASEEFDADGNVAPGSFYCLPMAKIKPEFSPQLVGQAAGAEIPTVPKLDAEGQPVNDADGKPIAGKVVILGVYRNAPPKVEEKPAEAATEAPVAEAKSE